jgi:hypothetical protein
MTSATALQGSAPQNVETRMQTSLTFLGIRRMYQRVLLSVFIFLQPFLTLKALN